MSGRPGERLAHDWFPRPLPANVRLGPGAWLYSSFAFLHYRSRSPLGVCIGRSSGVYAGSFFELGPRGEVRIGDYSTLVGAIIRSDRRVEIGDHCFVAHEVVLADRDGARPPVRDAGLEAGPEPVDPVSIRLESNVWVGARAVLLAGTRVGEGSIVGAGTLLDAEVPAYSVVAGNPARVVGRLPRPGDAR